MPGRLRGGRGTALPAAPGRRCAERPVRTDQPDPRGRRATRRRRRPRRPARGDHRAVRGRDAHGALPRRRGDRHRHAGRRPGDRRRPRLLPPGRSRLRDGRRRAGRAAGAARRRVPVAAGAPAAPRLRDRRLRAPPADRGPGRAARGRGRPHLRGRLRGPGVAGAGVLRDAAARDLGARQRARPPADHGGRRTPPTKAATTPTSGSRTSTSRSVPSSARSRRASPATSPR